MRLIIVEDHPVFLEGLTLLLESEPDIDIVWTGADPRAAIDETARLQPDLVIVDHFLRGMNGIQLIEHLRRTQPDLKVLVLTGCQQDEVVLGLLRAGASSLLFKDAMPDELLQAIRLTDRGQAVVAPAATPALLGVLQGSRGPAGHLRQSTSLFPDGLTEREVEVLRLACTGHSNRTVAQQLVISERTVENHIRNIFHKLRITDRSQAVLYAVRHGIISLN